MTCSATVTIVRKQGSTTTKMGGITVSGTWNSVQPNQPGWPADVSAITVTSGTKLGQATLTNTATLPSITGRNTGCSFVVNSVAGPAGTNWALDPALTLAQRTGSKTW